MTEPIARVTEEVKSAVSRCCPQLAELTLDVRGTSMNQRCTVVSLLPSLQRLGFLTSLSLNGTQLSLYALAGLLSMPLLHLCLERSHVFIPDTADSESDSQLAFPPCAGRLISLVLPTTVNFHHDGDHSTYPDASTLDLLRIYTEQPITAAAAAAGIGALCHLRLEEPIPADFLLSLRSLTSLDMDCHDGSADLSPLLDVASEPPVLLLPKLRQLA